ncbi:hypothetical protein NDR87_17960 [Nocardia sp. CDC159]|uniref:Uncharacterized protein n=1 Tax=Nocardia pulmonis TaxID=2951408 RepID=A0A9X2E8U3_9NOCA|nr:MULTISPECIES: hypothetical protein [Nocardia]MCM6775776.1 hypothetical protein [Nocardia pulmonis]MCM6788248.1 hypothetical protein [Nocardia sp. CDC159]
MLTRIRGRVLTPADFSEIALDVLVRRDEAGGWRPRRTTPIDPARAYSNR